MSLQTIPVTQLYEIASNISKSKKDALVRKYYNEIMIATYEGKFTITFILESDKYGKVVSEEWEATEEVEGLFPGIQTSYDIKHCTYTFEWYKEDSAVRISFLAKQAGLQCSGCRNEEANQLGHMSPGGCLYNHEGDSDTNCGNSACNSGWCGGRI